MPPDLLQRLMYVGQRKVAGEIIQALGNVSPSVAITSAGNPLLGVFAPPVSFDIVSLQDAAKAVAKVIRDIAMTGDVLISGPGRPGAAARSAGACHVLFVAPLELRVAQCRRSSRTSRCARRGAGAEQRRIADGLPGALSQHPLARSAAISSGHQHRPDREAAAADLVTLAVKSVAPSSASRRGLATAAEQPDGPVLPGVRTHVAGCLQHPDPNHGTV